MLLKSELAARKKDIRRYDFQNSIIPALRENLLNTLDVPLYLKDILYSTELSAEKIY